MKKSRKKIVAGVALFGMIMSGLGVAGAATYHGYDVTVPVVNDYESTPRTKQTTGSAYNKVSSIQKDRGSLVSWVENSDGDNITNKETYSSTGTKTMDYESASTHKGKSLHLNISTSTSNLKSTSTVGEWTPN